MFTILSEFSCYTEDDVLSFSRVKLEIVYKEALRQRASRYTMMEQVLNRHEYKDSTQREIADYLKGMLSPYPIVKEYKEEVVDSGWNSLRAGRR